MKKSMNASVRYRDIPARKNEDFYDLLKRFNDSVYKCGILKEIRKKEYYLKPSARKRADRRENMANPEK